MKEKNELLSVVLPSGMRGAFRARAKKAGFIDGSECLRALVRGFVDGKVQLGHS